MKIEKFITKELSRLGDDQISTSSKTPLKKDAFKITDSEKIKLIEIRIREILDILGMDLNDDSLSGTPKRVAKMFINEIYSGINPLNKPKTSTFKNDYKYGEMLVEKNISVNSTCEHHLLPILGTAHISYISNGRIIGLSKINRIVDYFSKRPQVQERLTLQIVQELQKILKTKDVACVIDAKHLCINSRGIRDNQSSTVTSEFSGRFKEKEIKREFLDYIKLGTNL